MAAAARSNRAASAFAAAQLGERLLDQARALAVLDGQGRLSPAALEAVARRNPLFRVAVFAADGSREGWGAPSAEAGRGGHGPRGGWARGAGGGPGGGPGVGPGRGFGGGRGPGGGGAVLRQLLGEGKQEVVTGAHASRWGGERVAAGVKRQRGGAIVVTVDATEIAALEKPASLESLLQEITSGSPEIAYTVFEHEDGRIAFGDVPTDEPASPGERSLTVAAGPCWNSRATFPSPGARRRGCASGCAWTTCGASRSAWRCGWLPRWRPRPSWWPSPSASPGCVAATGSSARSTRGRRRRCGRRDRLAAMGELASTVAHEVRNPLNAIAMSAQRLQREFLDAAPANAGAGRSSRSCSRS